MKYFKRICGFVLVSMLTVFILGCFLHPRTVHTIRFNENPCIKPHNRYHYLTCHPIDVTVDGVQITIPGDFDTDLASIPRWFWTFLSPAYSGFIAPSILHDYLYSCSNGFTRKQVDDIFYYSLIQNGVSSYTSFKMYLAVRLFGNAYYQDLYCVYQDNDDNPEMNDEEQIDYD